MRILLVEAQQRDHTGTPAPVGTLKESVDFIGFVKAAFTAAGVDDAVYLVRRRCARLALPPPRAGRCMCSLCQLRAIHLRSPSLHSRGRRSPPCCAVCCSQLRASDDIADFIYEAESEFTNVDAVTRFNGLDFVFFFGTHSMLPWFPPAQQVRPGDAVRSVGPAASPLCHYRCHWRGSPLCRDGRGTCLAVVVTDWGCVRRSGWLDSVLSLRTAPLAVALAACCWRTFWRTAERRTRL